MLLELTDTKTSYPTSYILLCLLFSKPVKFYFRRLVSCVIAFFELDTQFWNWLDLVVNFLLTNSLLKHEIFKFREIAKLFFQKSHQIVVGQAFFQNCLETLKKTTLCSQQFSKKSWTCCNFTNFERSTQSWATNFTEENKSLTLIYLRILYI